MKTIKYSRQRESIKDYLMSNRNHPTADMVYSAIKEIYPHISLGTVYRNLAFLVEQGEVIKLSCGEEYERFDINTSQHYHFICQNCHQVIDLEMHDIDHINVVAGNNFGGRIDGHKIYFFGICKECLHADKK